MRKEGIFLLMVVVSIGLISAAITDDLHLNLQTTYVNGTVQTGTFDFVFNVSTDSACSTGIVYNYTFDNNATDNRGIVDFYLPSVTLDYDKQYYLCYKRYAYNNRSMIYKDNVTKLARVPYAFRATDVNLSEVSVDTNLDLQNNYNVTNGNYGFFSFLGNLTNRVTSLFVQDINASGVINATGNITTAASVNAGGNVTASWFKGLFNWTEDSPYLSFDGNTLSFLTGAFNTTYDARYINEDQEIDLNVNDSEYLDGKDSTFYMPYNKSVFGTFDFNGGWASSGVTIQDGDIYAQTGYFYNITSLDVTEQNLTINDDLLVFGNSDLRKNLTVDTNVLHVDSNSNRVGIGTISPSQLLDVAGALGGAAGSHSGEPVIRLTQTADTTYNIGDIHSGIEFYTEDPNGDHPGLQAYIRTVTTRGDGLTGADAGLVFGVSGLDDPVSGDLARDKMIIDGEGNVGIGTSSPDYPLQVNAESTGIVHANSSGDVKVFTQINGGYGKFLIRDLGGNNDVVLNTNGDSYFNGGNVGIGTTSPSDKLDVAGNISIIETDTANNDEKIGLIYNNVNPGTPRASINFYRGANSDDAEILFKTATDGTPTEAMRIDHNGKVGIGTDSPSGKLSLYDLSTNTSLNMQSQGQSRWWITADGNNNKLYIGGTGATEPSSGAINIHPGGNVGIGTSSPGAKLDIATGSGDNVNALRFSELTDGSLTFGFETDFAGAGDANHLRLASATTENLMTWTLNGNVGIGTSTPLSKLDIRGSGRFAHSSENTTVDIVGGTNISALRLYQGSGNWHIESDTSGDFNIGTGGVLASNTKFTILQSSGNVGIGTDSPSNALEVAGTFNATTSQGSLRVDSSGNIKVAI